MSKRRIVRCVQGNCTVQAEPGLKGFALSSSDHSYCQFVRLACTIESDELDCMDTYSGNTIVTLTATGWLHIAEEALLDLEQASDKKQAKQLRCKVQRSLRIALVAVAEDDRSSG
jgi:hypothetical protein